MLNTNQSINYEEILFFNVLYCKLLFSVPDIAEINKYDVLQITESEWVSECLLFIANSAIFQLYYGENK